MAEDIRIFELKRMDLKGAIVIDGFPSIGLVSSIVANYLIKSLDLEQIGIMDSMYFPTVSLIRGSEPHNPVRIYASPRVGDGDGIEQVVAFISEFQPPPNLVKAIASTILDWAIEQKCSVLISPEGLVVDREDEESEETTALEPGGEVAVYGVGSTTRARNMLEGHGISTFEEGVITGVAGVLLNEGKRRDFSVLSLLAEAHPDYPDARAAAKIIEAIDKMLLKIDIDAQPLYAEAENVESQIKAIHKQTEVIKPPRSSVPSPSMYR